MKHRAFAICPDCSFTTRWTDEWYAREAIEGCACGHCSTGRMIVFRELAAGIGG